MKKNVSNLLLLFAATVLFIGCEADQPELQPEAQNISKAIGPWQRVFTDNFNANGNLNQWEKTNRSDYNSSICNYVSTNPAIGSLDNKSCLVLTAYNDGRYKSGHVKSYFSFNPANNQEFRVYARIKLIAKQGTNFKGFNETYGAWPAFWTVQENAWPTKGEIDIMEGYSYGNSSKFAANLFYGVNAGTNQLGNTAERSYTVSEGWHNYNLYWKKKNGVVTCTVTLDGSVKATYTNAVNGNLKLENFGPHNIILNLNVGSNSNLNIFNNSNIKLFDRTQMYVDWVAVDKRTI